VRHKAPTVRRAGQKACLRKCDMVSDRERLGPQHRRGFGCGLVRVNTDLTKVLAETPLHEATSGGLERLTWGAQHFIDKRCCNLFPVAALDLRRRQTLLFRS
jgi:hypothetical protein